jgi:hypothetical protein
MYPIDKYFRIAELNDSIKSKRIQGRKIDDVINENDYDF